MNGLEVIIIYDYKTFSHYLALTLYNQEVTFTTIPAQIR